MDISVNNTKNSLKRLKVIKRIIVLFVLFIPVCTIFLNMVSRQRLYYLLQPIFFCGVGDIVESPDSTYLVYIKSCGMQAGWFNVEIAKWYYIIPKTILTIDTAYDIDNSTIPTGPYGDVLDVVWSKNNRYAALVYDGWFVDIYDFETGKSLKTISLPTFKYSKIDMRYMLTGRHEKIKKLLGEGAISLRGTTKLD